MKLWSEFVSDEFEEFFRHSEFHGLAGPIISRMKSLYLRLDPWAIVGNESILLLPRSERVIDWYSLIRPEQLGD